MKMTKSTRLGEYFIRSQNISVSSQSGCALTMPHSPRSDEMSGQLKVTIEPLSLADILSAWTGDCVGRMFLFQVVLTNGTILLPHIRLPFTSQS